MRYCTDTIPTVLCALIQTKTDSVEGDTWPGWRHWNASPCQHCTCLLLLWLIVHSSWPKWVCCLDRTAVSFWWGSLYVKVSFPSFLSRLPSRTYSASRTQHLSSTLALLASCQCQILWAIFLYSSCIYIGGMYYVCCSFSVRFEMLKKKSVLDPAVAPIY